MVQFVTTNGEVIDIDHSKEPSTNVSELGASDQGSKQIYEDEKPLRQDSSFLPPKPLRRYRRMTWKNILLIICALILLGGAVYGAYFPGAVAGWPFLRMGRFVAYNEAEAPICVPWDQTLQINIAAGNFSFTTVKVIDAAVNLFLGRGSQIMLAFLCYHLFGMAILRVMQDSSLPVDCVVAVAFDATSVRSIFYLFKGMCFVRSWRARCIMAWLGVSIIWVIVFPTLLDLSTGYIAKEDVQVALNDDHSIWGSPTANFTSAARDIWNCYNTVYMGWGGHLTHLDCQKESNPVYLDDTRHITVDQILFTNLTWNLYDPVTNRDGLIRCVPKREYEWGISSGYIFMLSTSLGIWLIGISAIWFDTMRYGHLWHTGRGFGRYRNIIDIGHFLDRQLGRDLCAYNHEELNEHVSRLPPIGLEVTSDGNCGHIRLSETPGGSHWLKSPGLYFGSRGRIEDTRVHAGQE